MPTVRRAVAADAPVVVEFNRLLALESEGKELDLAELGPGVAAALADPIKSLYFVAEEDGQVVGQTMVTYEWSDWNNGWLWWIQSVYVRSDYRGRGVFRALYDHVRHTAQQDRGVVGLRLYVEQDNRSAQEIYAHFGFQRTSYFILERCPP
jgi:ribosomal protein S18 acetylase RimI-like enzyme